MRKLRSLHSLPYATPSGRIVAKPGYDEETQIYLDLPLDHVPVIPCKPTLDQVEAALVTMMRPWQGYRWETEADAGAMVSAVLTAVFRPSLSLAPAYLMDASSRGNGKTLAATALGCLRSGRQVSVTPSPGDGSGSDDEIRKKLFAAGMAGTSFICLDNLVGHFKSASLAGVLTSGRISDRVLGASKFFDVESSLLVTATGNNASLDSDLLRRFVRCRMDGGPNPMMRRFSFKPTDRALNERLKIADSACTLLLAYWQNGAPRIAADDAGGFEHWSALCRQPVLWAASKGLTDGLGWGRLGDPAASLLADPSRLDPEIESLGDLLVNLHNLAAGLNFTSREVLAWYREGAADRTGEGARKGLYEAVRELLGTQGGTEDPSCKTLGRTLLNGRDNVVQGFALRASGFTGGVRVWKVVRVPIT